MIVSFEFAALRYLNLWLLNDRQVLEDVTAADRNTKFSARAKGATFFRIARSVPKKYDVGQGLPRFGPVLDIIDSLTTADFHADRTTTVKNVRDQMSAKYGNRDVLSLTTKFLWIKIQSPIIIYHGQVRRALGTPNGDLDAYYTKWQNEAN